MEQFGNNFLTKFEGSVVDAPILRNITLVDTPGESQDGNSSVYELVLVYSWAKYFVQDLFTEFTVVETRHGDRFLTNSESEIHEHSTQRSKILAENIDIKSGTTYWLTGRQGSFEYAGLGSSVDRMNPNCYGNTILSSDSYGFS